MGGQMKLSGDRLRLLILGVLVGTVLGLYLFRLMRMQIVDGADYEAELTRGSSRTQVIKAARGEIVDRYGRPFAQNEISYDVMFDRALMPAEQENEIILRLTGLMRQSGEDCVDNLPVTREAPFQFTDDAGAVEKLRDFLNLQPYSSCSDVLHWLYERYGLSDYPESDARTLAGVRYEMEQRGYSLTVRYTFARAVGLDTAVLIRQMGFSLQGVDLVETARRSYSEGNLAPHVIGRVGAMFADEIEEYEAKGYTRDELVGKEGIEKAFEDELRGTDGVRRIDLNADLEVVNVSEETPPAPGNNVVLTLDMDLQRVAIEAMERQIKYLNETAPAGHGREANAGAVAAVDVNTGEVLALVSYPSYDVATYSSDYAALVADPNNPLFNRALQGVYAPGSTFKPCVAAAGLNEGVITPDTVITCQRVYTFYPSYQPTCLSYHGAFRVTDALRESCNIFFYETGRRLGIETINRYARELGLGSPTGIELGEAGGTQSDPDTANPGDALQTAIGQLDNGYTPLMMANYAATLARNGSRLKLSLVHSISSYNFEETLFEHQPEVAYQMDVPQWVFDTVRDGMVQCSRTGSARGTFASYPIDVASKTGTPQTKDYPNSTFICYAPAEDPQIAVAVIIEKGWHGYTGAPVAKAIFDQYFYPEGDFSGVQGAQTLLP